jgi:general stress protein 26
MGEVENFIKNYEDVTKYGLDAADEATMIDQQNECTFCWTTADGSPMAVIMSYLEHDGKFWLTASSQRKRIPAIRRDPRVCIVITSTGAPMGRNKTVTYKGTANLHDDALTKEWFYPALAERLMSQFGQERVDLFAKFLDSPRRVIVSVDKGLRVGYDGAKMGADTQRSVDAGVAWQ